MEGMRAMFYGSPQGRKAFLIMKIGGQDVTGLSLAQIFYKRGRNKIGNRGLLDWERDPATRVISGTHRVY